MFHSSGTTQHRPSRHFHNTESLALYEISLLTTFAAHLLQGCEDIKFPFIILTPPPGEAAHSSLVHMFETARRALGAYDSIFTGNVDPSGAWTLDFEKTESALRACAHRNQPAVLLGTAFSFVHLLDHFQRNKIKVSLPKGSRLLETGGYKGRSRTLPKSELHSWLSRDLGLALNAIVSEYGMCELSSQAYDSIASFSSNAAGSDMYPTNQEPLFGVQPSGCCGEDTLKRGHQTTSRAGAQLAGSFAGSRLSRNSRPFRFAPWARVQIVSPENGTEVTESEIGMLRVFDLANVRSVMAIQTEDLGVRLPEGFELFGRSTAVEPRGCSLMPAT